MLKKILGLELIFCQDLSMFESIESPKINYSSVKIPNSFQINPVNLLFIDELHPELADYVIENNIPIFYPIHDSDLAFDPFAAGFYVVSRYEEYIISVRDKHNRFPSSESLQSITDCLRLPIVQVWANMLAEAIVRKFPGLVINNVGYNYIPTYDIDMAWSYQEKGTLRTAGAWAKSILMLDLPSIVERWKVLTNKIPDPFDTFDYLDKSINSYDLNAIYFILLGQHSDYDKNINPNNASFAQLIKRIAASHSVGIHPSYFSKKSLRNEINSLTSILKREITRSRQHYVRLDLPQTYKHLLANGIKEDYTMGYPDILGFRNGTAVPTPWYNLEEEVETDLIIHPFQIMDVTLKNYLKLTPKKAIMEIHTIVDIIKQYGGSCISIWHNSSFDKQWAGWEKVHEEMLSYASK